MWLQEFFSLFWWFHFYSCVCVCVCVHVHSHVYLCIKYWAFRVRGGKSLMMKSFHRFSVIHCKSFLCCLVILQGRSVLTAVSVCFWEFWVAALLWFYSSKAFHPFNLHFMRICCYLLDADFIYFALPHFLWSYDVAYNFIGSPL